MLSKLNVKFESLFFLIWNFFSVKRERETRFTKNLVFKIPKLSEMLTKEPT